MIIFFISAGLFWYIENDINPNISTFGDAFYFTVVSLTTVGFGDITPVSDGGKWVTMLNDSVRYHTHPMAGWTDN